MYNFDKIVNRRQTNSIKYDREKAQDTRIIPMWVADMDFETLPEVKEQNMEFLDMQHQLILIINQLFIG